MSTKEISELLKRLRALYRKNQNSSVDEVYQIADELAWLDKENRLSAPVLAEIIPILTAFGIAWDPQLFAMAGGVCYSVYSPLDILSSLWDDARKSVCLNRPCYLTESRAINALWRDYFHKTNNASIDFSYEWVDFFDADKLAKLPKSSTAFVKFIQNRILNSTAFYESFYSVVCAYKYDKSMYSVLYTQLKKYVLSAASEGDWDLEFDDDEYELGMELINKILNDAISAGDSFFALKLIAYLVASETEDYDSKITNAKPYIYVLTNAMSCMPDAVVKFIVHKDIEIRKANREMSKAKAERDSLRQALACFVSDNPREWRKVRKEYFSEDVLDSLNSVMGKNTALLAKCTDLENKLRIHFKGHKFSTKVNSDGPSLLNYLNELNYHADYKFQSSPIPRLFGTLCADVRNPLAHGENPTCSNPKNIINQVYKAVVVQIDLQKKKRTKS